MSEHSLDRTLFDEKSPLIRMKVRFFVSGGNDQVKDNQVGRCDSGGAGHKEMSS